MNFHETVIGKQFLEVQFPRMVRSLEMIATMLEGIQGQKPIVLPMELPDNFLEELYQGNVEIGVESYEQYSAKRLKSANSVYAEIEHMLTKEELNMVSKYAEELGAYYQEETCRMFQHGYRLGIRLVAAGLQMPKNK
ncbi:MAG: DUF6809 family protein [Monoglobales bacterium]